MSFNVAVSDGQTVCVITGKQIKKAMTPEHLHDLDLKCGGMEVFSCIKNIMHIISDCISIH